MVQLALAFAGARNAGAGEGVKSRRSPASGKRADRRVVYWTALLLVALGLVFTALFYSGRYVLSFDRDQDSEHQDVLHGE
jgi:hypothetical protein